MEFVFRQDNRASITNEWIRLEGILEIGKKDIRYSVARLVIQISGFRKWLVFRLSCRQIWKSGSDGCLSGKLVIASGMIEKRSNTLGIRSGKSKEHSGAPEKPSGNAGKPSGKVEKRTGASGKPPVTLYQRSGTFEEAPVTSGNQSCTPHRRSVFLFGSDLPILETTDFRSYT